MRIKHVWIAAALVACSGDDSGKTDGGIYDAPVVDAPEFAPMITSFTATPSQVQAGVATTVTWNWTYANEPTVPDPTCEINNSVGPVTRGQGTQVTLTAVTTFTLTCTNRAGMASRQVVVGVPPVAPVLATFTATPSTLTANTPTTVTFAWTYANTPTPTPTCTIEHGIGTVTTGATSMETLAQSRTYRLRCTNTAGSATRDVTVNVDECASATHDCGPNSTCTDTANGFTCACNASFTGNGDVCSAQVACGTTPALCDANATCVNGTSCVCNTGYFGPGTTCTRARYMFVTSTTGNGNLSTWAGATPSTGLAAADAVCNARAAAAGLPGTYVAWMSDSLNDAYCRVHGLSGKKSASCGQGALPTDAGPWVRPPTSVASTAATQPVAPRIDRLVAPTRETLFPASYTELGAELSFFDSFTRVFTGTDDGGAYATNTCSDGTTNSSIVTGVMGEVWGGGTSWTDLGTDPACSSTGRLRCVEVSATSGPALPSRHPVARKAFVTSVTGTGLLSSWADAGGLSGIAAADAVCQARARYAGYSNPQAFKAWMSGSSSSTYASTRIVNTGTWARPDGIPIASSESDLYDGRIAAPLYQMETNEYASGNSETGNVWTGTSTNGSSSFSYCSIWASNSTGIFATIGRHDVVDARWTAATTLACNATYRLYCLED